ncbi:alpha-L-fucosidase [Marinilactibacillus sp. XAAS-LB27]|uniref:alpha-L-fucosidase n=1 Tax=Marinilactibacillus sp. XAAS-LB27 TaxID=3114538 RepID=UPI002E18B437|nr:alpha-L-fucosidase [Marinilactibacillus sp. XAAS-LB27]
MTNRLDIETREASETEAYTNLPKEIKDKLEWFQDQKLGVIFHWGLYAEAGIVESWQLSEEDEWARAKKPWRNSVSKLREDYWKLNKTFNPKHFDPITWADLCKDAGFKYMIFTTKHHDGFNMYDTQYSDYKITSSDSAFYDNPKADVFKEVVDAFRSKGLGIGAYYSKADWYSPYYWVPGQHAKGRTASYDPLEQPEMWKKFKGFVHDQLIELAKNYGPLDITWLDAGWVRKERTHEDLDMDGLAKDMRVYNPEMLIVDRSVGGDHENYVTPERKIPDTPPVKVWESNIPHAKNWGYVPNDIYKSDKEMIASIIQVVAKGGNLIIGIGPKPDGTLPEKSVYLLKTLAHWTKTYGEGIYHTRPFKQNSINQWYLTEKDQSVYAFCIPERDQEQYTLDLTKLDTQFEEEIIDLSTGEKAKVEDDHLIHHSKEIKGYRLTKNLTTVSQ